MPYLIALGLGYPAVTFNHRLHGCKKKKKTVVEKERRFLEFTRTDEETSFASNVEYFKKYLKCRLSVIEAPKNDCEET